MSFKKIFLNLIILTALYPFNLLPDSAQEEVYKNLGACNYLQQMKPIYFEKWTQNIVNKQDLEENVEAAVKILNQYPVFKLLILSQSAFYEKQYFMSDFIISMQRASVVKDYLIKNGIPENRLITTSLGSQLILDQPDNGDYKDTANNNNTKEENILQHKQALSRKVSIIPVVVS